jgi:hypothetical protein
LAASLSSFAEPGCSSRNIYREKVTGARPDRRELNRMLGKLAPGDVVTVTRIDRLARSTFDLFGIVKRIVHAKAQPGETRPLVLIGAALYFMLGVKRSPISGSLSRLLLKDPSGSRRSIARLIDR